MYEQGIVFQVAAQMTEGMCFGSGKEGGGRGGFFHAQAKAEARGQRKQEGECKYREEQLEGRH